MMHLALFQMMTTMTMMAWYLYLSFRRKTSAISCDKTSIYDLQDQSKKRSQSQEIESSNINLKDEDDISLANLSSKIQIFIDS